MFTLFDSYSDDLASILNTFVYSRESFSSSIVCWFPPGMNLSSKNLNLQVFYNLFAQDLLETLSISDKKCF